MPRKQGDKTYGAKLISLFSKLFFSNESHSLTELSKMLNCSKQTILKLVGDIQSYYGVDLEESMQGNRKYFRMKKQALAPAVNITDKEMSLLQMCRGFTEHLLGREIFQEAAQALEKSSALIKQDDIPSSKHFGSFRPGSIDYTPHHETIHTLIEAMNKKRVCKVTYKTPMAKGSKTYYIKPLKIFSHHDTIYLHARMAKYPGKPYKEPDFDPLLAIHRIVKISLTEMKFKFPKDYNFDKVFNHNFGIIKEESIKVEIEFTGYAGQYISERIWSPDQKIVKKRDGKIKLTFTSASEPEVIGWVLSFGKDAKVIRPKWLIEEILKTINAMKGANE